MAGRLVRLGEEAAEKRTFLWAVDWPGWCRSGRSRQSAVDALVAAGRRYVGVVARAGLSLSDPDQLEFTIVESVPGGSGTEFGVPSSITDHDRRRVTPREAARMAALVAAAWETFDRVAASSPAELRKGPRGGGRDRDKMIDHVLAADHAYAREIGVRLPAGSRPDPVAVATERAAVLDVIGRPSGGGPLAERKWTQRYAARRIAWHALDHAWEMEDRGN